MHSGTETTSSSPLGDDVDHWIDRWREGDDGALSQVFRATYDNLLSSASYLLSLERRHHYQPTELVHEAFLELARRPASEVRDRQHFLRYVLRCMRHFLMGRARARNTWRRGHGDEGIPLDEALDVKDPHHDAEQRADLRGLLDRLRRHDDDLWRVVDLHVRCGCTFSEVAHALGCSERTAKRQWRAAKDSLALFSNRSHCYP